MKSKCVKLASFILALLFVFPMTVFADITTYADYVNNDMGYGMAYKREGMSGGPIYASATIQCHGIVSSHGTSEYRDSHYANSI